MSALLSLLLAAAPPPAGSTAAAPPTAPPPAGSTAAAPPTESTAAAPPAPAVPLGAPATICLFRPAEMAMFDIQVSLGGKPVAPLPPGGVLRVDHPAVAAGTTYVDLQVPGLSNLLTVYARAGGMHLFSVVEEPQRRYAVAFDIVDERTDAAAVKRCAEAKATPLP